MANRVLGGMAVWKMLKQRERRGKMKKNFMIFFLCVILFFCFSRLLVFAMKIIKKKSKTQRDSVTYEKLCCFWSNHFRTSGEKNTFHPLEHQTFQFAIKKSFFWQGRERSKIGFSQLSKPHTSSCCCLLSNNMKNFSSLVRVSELVNIIILYSPTTNDDGKCARWCYWVALASNMRVTCGCEGLKSLDVKRFEILLSFASITIIRSSLKDAMKWKQMEVSRRRRIFCCVNGNDESLSLSFYLSLPNSLSLSSWIDSPWHMWEEF